MSEVLEMITPDEIDLSFVPVPIAEFSQAEVGTELVLVGGPDRMAHVLNPTASLVWRCFDGQATLAELVADLVEATGAEDSVVGEDVLALARQLGTIGLLEGVALPEEEHEDGHDHVAYTPPVAVEVGAELEPFVLPDLDGVDSPIKLLRSKRVLLVNWSPGCGYCVKIAETLAEVQDALQERNVELVFVTSGTAEANQGVFDNAGLRARTLVKQEGIDPFPGFGTPAAYLLDEEGRVAEPMAYGAVEVPALARTLAGVVEEAAEANPDIRYLPAPSAVCGPGGGAPASSTEWIGTKAYRIGEYHVGVRYNSEQTGTILDRMFAGAAVADPRVPANYSVALATGKPNGSRELNLLVHGGNQVVRSRSASRPLRALLMRISEDLAEPEDGLLKVAAAVAMRDDRALLLPSGISFWVKQLQPRFARLGIRVADVDTIARIDASAGEVVVPEPIVDHDPAVLAELDQNLRLGKELPAVLPGRYPVATWFLPVGEDGVGPMGAAAAVGRAIASVFAPTDLGQALEQLAGFFERVEPHGLFFRTPEELVSELTAALG